MKTSEILVLGRANIERGWTQKAYVRDSIGARVWPPDHPNVTCYCLDGSLLAVDWNVALENRPLARDLLLRKVARRGYCTIAAFNDAQGRKKEEILEVYDEAIAEAKLLDV